MGIKEWISTKGWKQVELAKKAKVNIAQLNKYLNGWEELPKKHQESLCDVLGISTEELNRIKSGGCGNA
jgi:transcriptional regulator with XRE-family HTH domain